MPFHLWELILEIGESKFRDIPHGIIFLIVTTFPNPNSGEIINVWSF